ncbi:MAG: alpha/beta fold hydrolase [Pseudomonadota bacterium]
MRLAEPAPSDASPLAGVPLAFAPGHLCDARIFAPQCESLGADQVFVVETRLDDDLGAMAERFLRDAPPRFALIGFSMGGMLAAEAIAQAPERILGAALIGADAGAARPKEIAWRAERVAEVEAAGARGLALFAEAFMARFFAHAPEAAAVLAPEMRAMAAPFDAEVFRRQAAALSSRRDNHAALTRYAARRDAGPLLFLCGAEDRLCPPLLSRRMQEAAPKGRLVLIEGCGHMATLEHPERVSRALLAWARACAEAFRRGS